MAIMNALMFQPQNTPKWGHRRTRVIMAHNTLIITIKCTKIIDADIIDANLSLKLDETKFKYTYIIYPSSIKYFSIREREREYGNTNLSPETPRTSLMNPIIQDHQNQKKLVSLIILASPYHTWTLAYFEGFLEIASAYVVSLSRDADAAIRLPINPRRGETR